MSDLVMFHHNGVDLCCRQSYLELSKENKARICNGAGPRNWGWIVPDTIWGMRITEESNIHDHGFSKEYCPDGGWSNEHMEQENRIYLNNMNRRNSLTKNRFLRWLRHRRILKYYNTVCMLGGMIYWKGKNMDSELGVAYEDKA